MDITLTPVSKSPTKKAGKFVYNCLYDNDQVVRLYSGVNYELMKPVKVPVRFGDIVFDSTRLRPSDIGVEKK